MGERKLLFSVTKKDLKIQFMRGSGNGGQNRNKRDTACRIIHGDSGAVGFAQEHRTQLQNKKAAFLRMTETSQFKNWCRIRGGHAVLSEAAIEEAVERLMAPENIKMEVLEDDKWVEVPYEVDVEIKNELDSVPERAI